MSDLLLMPFPQKLSLQIKKRSVKLFGHPTSVTLEDIFWDILKESAKEQKISLRRLIEKVDECHPENLSSALRVYGVMWLKTQVIK